MVVLGIETSCDDTAVALFKDGALVQHLRYSQTVKHNLYGGVVPEIAARDHALTLPPLVNELMHSVQMSLEDIQLIACTSGPGLLPALKAGVAVAQGLAVGLNIPLYGINHLEGHLMSVLLSGEELEFPWVSLLVSGGHTSLIQVDGLGAYKVLGTTLDDAAGECFDKSARLLGLDYPGGVEIEKMASKCTQSRFTLPRPMQDGSLNFSFSGLKTAVLYQLKNVLLADKSLQAQADQRQEDVWPEDIVAEMSFAVQEAITDVLVRKAKLALQQVHRDAGMKPILTVVGGVAANVRLRSKIEQELSSYKVVSTPLPYCTDNAAMIALVGWLRQQQSGTQLPSSLDIRARWPVEELAVPEWQH